MKKIAFILALFLVGCGKEQFDPTHNDFSVIGFWLGQDTGEQLEITDAKGKVTNNTGYTEYWQNNRRYLRRTFFGYPTTWEIVRITPDEMVLVVDGFNNSGSARFYRVK